ncbi:uncharacterized protein K452DRAFT_297057 [Aplosporella prunicola CBS 121167]|uniref:Uncharacterized protein n=1 Tax=Aplosporella prunicola CBS 121167 TaxID=1176127 RepID=A0A6A6BGL1_9PEZI|nr:uncharacterized protein K452DRAFT_297057 [Aplosporella prunicola CBS 121167]KAF2143300.1 hypothetical protein K452DRAFT_297057 [Aplosporella prunicola CBS 121167]
MLDAVARLLRPSTALPKESWVEDADISPVDALGPAVLERPSTPDDQIVPISPSPSTCGSSDSSLATHSPDHGMIKRRRLQRYVDPDLEAQVHYRRQLPLSVPAPRTCTVLETIVLQYYDVQRMDWMMIAEPLQRLYGLEVTSAGVLSILQQHGRVQRTEWWD